AAISTPETPKSSATVETPPVVAPAESAPPLQVASGEQRMGDRLLAARSSRPATPGAAPEAELALNLPRLQLGTEPELLKRSGKAEESLSDSAKLSEPLKASVEEMKTGAVASKPLEVVTGPEPVVQTGATQLAAVAPTPARDEQSAKEAVL